MHREAGVRLEIWLDSIDHVFSLVLSPYTNVFWVMSSVVLIIYFLLWATRLTEHTKTACDT